jgi:hypothetical protein
MLETSQPRSSKSSAVSKISGGVDGTRAVSLMPRLRRIDSAVPRRTSDGTRSRSLTPQASAA